MTEQEAMNVLHQAAAKVHQAGYVVSGCVSFIKPQNPGLVETVAAETFGPENRISFLTRRKGDDGALMGNAASPLVPLNAHEANVVLSAALKSGRPVKDTGEVCLYCGGVEFQRRGSCLYCTNCGSSLGGCS